MAVAQGLPRAGMVLGRAGSALALPFCKLWAAVQALSLHNCLQWPLPSICPCPSRGCSPSGCHTCTATLRGHVSTAQPEHELAFPSPAHLGSRQVVLHHRMGPWQDLAQDEPARRQLCSQSSPAAQRASGQLPASPSSLSAAHSWQPLPRWPLCPALSSTTDTSSL